MEPGLRIYVLKRVGFAALMLLGVSVMLFAVMRLAPGGPEAVLIGGEFSQEAAAQIRERLRPGPPPAPQNIRWGRAAPPGGLRRPLHNTAPPAPPLPPRPPPPRPPP